jgi:hypothetical protein
MGWVFPMAHLNFPPAHRWANGRLHIRREVGVNLETKHPMPQQLGAKAGKNLAKSCIS